MRGSFGESITARHFRPQHPTLPEFLKKVLEETKHNFQVCISTVNQENLNRAE
jgi:DNA-binding MurR/RpiR family transcriptional regulator